MKIRKNLEPSPIPNHTTTSGISAIFGRGRRNWTNGSRTALSVGASPMLSPSGTPTAMATAKAARARAALIRKCCHSGVCR